MVFEIFRKAAITSFAAIGVYGVNLSNEDMSSVRAQTLMGLALFLVAFAIMISPIQMSSGAKIDARTVPVIVAGMTGGMAHDFNNLLAMIHGNLEMLLDEKDLSSKEVMDMITGSFASARRGEELTRSMLAFARRSERRPERLKVDSIVAETEG